MRNALTVRLAESQETRLAAYAKSIGLTAPEVARIAIAEYLDDHAPQAQKGSASMDEYAKENDWGGYTVRKSEKGFVVTSWSARQGELTDDKYLVHYTNTLTRDVDLAAMWNETMTYADAIHQAAGAGPGSITLRKGRIVH